MKLITPFILICLFLAGCGKKEAKPISIFIKKDGTFVINKAVYNRHSLRDFQDFIAKKRDKEGVDLPIYYMLNKGTTYRIIKPIIDVPMTTGLWSFYLQIDSSKPEIFNIGLPDGPPSVDINLKIIKNSIYINNLKTNISKLEDLVKEEPKKYNGYRIFISCDDNSPVDIIYDILKFCNQYDYIYPILNTEETSNKVTPLDQNSAPQKSGK
jgi:biopolymer transport protein ExbD